MSAYLKTKGIMMPPVHCAIIVQQVKVPAEVNNRRVHIHMPLKRTQMVLNLTHSVDFKTYGVDDFN